MTNANTNTNFLSHFVIARGLDRARDPLGRRARETMTRTTHLVWRFSRARDSRTFLENELLVKI